MRELGLLIKPSPHGPAHLITPENTSEFSRVYYHNGQYQCGSAGARVGYSTVVSCDVGDRGCVVGFNTGHRVHIAPDSYCLSWVP